MPETTGKIHVQVGKYSVMDIQFTVGSTGGTSSPLLLRLL
jgi:hypothetical protein